MFPPGGPGVGLLLLRVSVAATFLLNRVNRAGELTHPLFAVALLIAVALAVGFLTPYLSFIVCLYGLANLVLGNSRPEDLIFVLYALNAFALALLGPGAYSVDARLFGRRVVVVPPRKDSDQ